MRTEKDHSPEQFEIGRVKYIRRKMYTYGKVSFRPLKSELDTTVAKWQNSSTKFSSRL